MYVLGQPVPSSPITNVTLVITLRADFLGSALSYRPFADALQQSTLTIGPMTGREQQETIEKPAQKLNIKIEEGLAERILADVEWEPGSLPLLEFALTQLWAKQREGKLTHAAYREIGGVELALAVYAEEVYEQFSEEERQRVQQILIQLVHPGEGTEDVRRIATRAELGEEHWTIVKRLADARLVVSGRDEATGKETAEVVHEALIRGWKRLRTWLEVDREFRIWQERLRATLHEWEMHNEDDDTLLRGAPLTVAERWMIQHPEAISMTEQAFIQRSIARKQQQEIAEHAQQVRDLELQRRAVRRQRNVIGMMVVTSMVLVVALIVTLLLYGQLQGANQELQRSLPVKVINLNDHGPGSLREAITTALPGSVITFAKDLKGTIMLTSGELKVTHNLTINGPGASALSISGGNISRVFYVSTNITVTISNVTIKNGHAMNRDKEWSWGGGIENEGTLALTDSIITGNMADMGGGINSFGMLTLSESTISDNTATGTTFYDYGGGGISSSGILNLFSSTVSSNAAPRSTGGGIRSSGDLTLINSKVSDNIAEYGGGIDNVFEPMSSVRSFLLNSTVSGNTAKADGGGISNDGSFRILDSTVSGNTARVDGGGIINNQYLSLTDSTISGNKASRNGGGILNSRAFNGGENIDLTYCTFYGNTAKVGGGMADETMKTGRITMRASIVAGDTADKGPDISATITLYYSNLIQNASDAQIDFGSYPNDPAVYEFSKRSTIIGKSPNVGPLQGNGGLTQTHALLAGSPAIDQIPLVALGDICVSGNTGTLGFDQRGIKRPRGRGCDIGAYEYVPA